MQVLADGGADDLGNTRALFGGPREQARLSSGSRRTDSTVAMPDPIVGRPGWRRRRSSSTSYPGSASSAIASTDSSVMDVPSAFLPWFVVTFTVLAATVAGTWLAWASHG
jgi:hypothetical protein